MKRLLERIEYAMLVKLSTIVGVMLVLIAYLTQSETPLIMASFVLGLLVWAVYMGIKKMKEDKIKFDEYLKKENGK